MANQSSNHIVVGASSQANFTVSPFSSSTQSADVNRCSRYCRHNSRKPVLSVEIKVSRGHCDTSAGHEVLDCAQKMVSIHEKAKEKQSKPGIKSIIDRKHVDPKVG